MSKKKALNNTNDELFKESELSKCETAIEKTLKKRQANAEKQARFRKSMKEQGYKLIKYWEKPPTSGMVKPWGNSPPPLIKEGSMNICERNTATKKAIDKMMSAFFLAMRGKNDNMTKESWEIYKDIEILLSPLGYKETE